MVYKLCFRLLDFASSEQSVTWGMMTAASTEMMTTTISTSINVNAERCMQTGIERIRNGNSRSD